MVLMSHLLWSILCSAMSSSAGLRWDCCGWSHDHEHLAVCWRPPLQQRDWAWWAWAVQTSPSFYKTKHFNISKWVHCQTLINRSHSNCFVSLSKDMKNSDLGQTIKYWNQEADVRHPFVVQVPHPVHQLRRRHRWNIGNSMVQTSSRFCHQVAAQQLNKASSHNTFVGENVNNPSD